MAEAYGALGKQNTGTHAPIYTLKQVVNAAFTLGLPVAVWRLPSATHVQVCISFTKNQPVAQPDLENSPFGFLFSPFIAEENQPTVFIDAAVVYTSETGQLQFSADVTHEQQQEFILVADQVSDKQWHIGAEQNYTAQTETGFKDAVAEAIEQIENGVMEKVVLSRTSALDLPSSFNLPDTFNAVLDAYPRAFVSLVSVPAIGTWLGASPEILVSIDTQQIFRTVALAGTQPAKEGDSAGNAIWRQKEIEEQGMVERYILSCFKKIRLREYSEVGPRTIIAGNLMHLRTDFSVDLKEVDYPTLGSDMLQMLHPTSAVCGLPKEQALTFIKSHEGYNRGYYSGYLGPVNSPEGTHLYVNLRCMQLLKNKVILYAGAGITGESDVEKEWQETQHKMQTMGKILSDFNFE